jgi:hypothetical protein
MSHNATHRACVFKLWNGCGTNRARIGDSLQLLLRSPQHLALALCLRTRSSLRGSDKRRFRVEFLKFCEDAESNQKRGRVNRDSRSSSRRTPGPTPRDPSVGQNGGRLLQQLTPVVMGPGSWRAIARWAGTIKSPHCVLATCGGVAWVMNWVASSMAGPSGVGIFIQNGTRMRVPATGAKAISMLRWAARYLITARSGM